MSSRPPVGTRGARPEELSRLQEIERAAGALFAAIGTAEVAADEPQSLAALEARRLAGTALVAAAEGGGPLAYLVAAVVDEALHVEQVSVHPDHGRQGIGRLLLQHAALLVRERGLAALTLTTFAEVPWNAPYYERCGFRTLAEAELTPGLLAIWEEEGRMGCQRWPRVCMWLPLED